MEYYHLPVLSGCFLSLFLQRANCSGIFRDIAQSFALNFLLCFFCCFNLVFYADLDFCQFNLCRRRCMCVQLLTCSINWLRDNAHYFFAEYIPTNLCHSYMYPSLTIFSVTILFFVNPIFCTISTYFYSLHICISFSLFHFFLSLITYVNYIYIHLQIVRNKATLSRHVAYIGFQHVSGCVWWPRNIISKFNVFS